MKKNIVDFFGSIKLSWLGLLFKTAIVLFFIHLIWSGILLGVIYFSYGHRLFNLTKIDSSRQAWVVFLNAYFSDYIDRMLPNQINIIFVGSSFTYGYPWQEEVIFSRLIEKKSPGHVGNMSVVAAGVQGIFDFSICGERRKDLPDLLIAEIPLINSVRGAIASPVPESKNNCYSQTKYYTYENMVFRRPWGLDWGRILWDDEAYSKVESDILISPVGKGYLTNAEEFSVVQEKYVRDLKVYLEYISHLGKTVLVYVSPVYAPGISELGEDRAGVEYQFNLSYEICRQNGKVICLDASSFNTRRELFYNLTHLNQRGHRAMAQWFEQQIAEHGKTSRQSISSTPSN